MKAAPLFDTVGALLAVLRLGDRPADVADAVRTADPRLWRLLVAHERAEAWLDRRLGALELRHLIDAETTSWLRHAVRSQTAAHLLIDHEAEEVARRLAGAGVEHIFLKGVARRLLRDRHPYGDARSIGDVDVLVEPGRADDACAALLDDGYLPAFEASLTPEGHYHERPLAGPRGVVVEVHSSTSDALEPERAWRRQSDGARRVERGKVRFRVPSDTELAWHALTHALTHGAEWFGLRGVLDLSSLAASDAVDVDEMGRRLESAEVPDQRAASLWLGAARRMAGETGGWLSDLGAHDDGTLERLLRWRARVLPRHPPETMLGRKLLEESTRAEFREAPEPDPSETAWRGARTRVGATIGRLAYSVWSAGSKGRSPL